MSGNIMAEISYPRQYSDESDLRLNLNAEFKTTANDCKYTGQNINRKSVTNSIHKTNGGNSIHKY